MFVQFWPYYTLDQQATWKAAGNELNWLSAILEICLIAKQHQSQLLKADVAATHICSPSLCLPLHSLFQFPSISYANAQQQQKVCHKGEKKIESMEEKKLQQGQVFTQW